ncbi:MULTISPECIES: hypothetical protein [unclassified Chryseobacterium]|uniref:hypothetical protein n=1 Tax=unclassified Chryseobacterium TaxID=2593645 RepID=UPI0030169BFD
MKTFSKHISFIILLCLAFFLIPNIGFACTKEEIKKEQKSCSKNQSTKAEKKDCCKTKSCKKDKDHNDCNGKCKHSSCRCSTSSSSLSLPIPIDLKTTNHFAEIKKQKFGFKQAYYSSGYSSIWQPPKIG